jgi:hypothetical protein
MQYSPEHLPIDRQWTSLPLDENSEMLKNQPVKSGQLPVVPCDGLHPQRLPDAEPPRAKVPFFVVFDNMIQAVILHANPKI